MIVRALDSTGDFTFGRGKGNYLSQNNAVAQVVVTKLKSFLGDCFFDVNAGIDWFNLLGGKNQLAIEISAANAITRINEVTKLVEVSASTSDARNTSISYSINTVYSVSATDTLDGTAQIIGD